MSCPYRCVHFPSCDSTHAWALNNSTELIAGHGLDSMVPLRISTDLQTRGIGQRSSTGSKPKTWVSSPGNVFVTFVHPWPNTKIGEVVRLPYVAAVSVVNVLQRLKLEAKVKWVNDVVVNSRKIAGILCGSTSWSVPSTGNDSDKSFSAVLISIGLNVLSVPSLSTLDEEEQQSVTCIATELEKIDNNSQVIKSFVGSCMESHQQYTLSSSQLFAETPRGNNPSFSTLQYHRQRSSTPSDNKPVLTHSLVLNALSYELHRLMVLYELHGFTSIYPLINPILSGLGQIVTIRNPSINPASITSSVATLIQGNPSSTIQPVELRGIVIGLSPESGFLLVKLFDRNRTVVEIFNGHLTLMVSN